MGAAHSEGEIATERLRQLTPPRDAARIGARCGRQAVARWLGRWPHPYPASPAERSIDLVHASGGRAWTIDRRDEPGLIGVIGLDGPHARQSLGDRLGPVSLPIGSAGEAASAVLERAFRLGAGALLSGALEVNAGLRGIQAKLGFGIAGQPWLRCEALDRDPPHTDMRPTRADREMRA